MMSGIHMQMKYGEKLTLEKMGMRILQNGKKRRESNLKHTEKFLKEEKQIYQTGFLSENMRLLWNLFMK